MSMRDKIRDNIFDIEDMDKSQKYYSMKRLAKVILMIPINIWLMFITYCPGEMGEYLRYRFWKKRLKYLGKGVRIGVGVEFQNPGYISIRDNCWIDRNVIIKTSKLKPGIMTHVKDNVHFRYKRGEVHIDENCRISPNCILSGTGGLSLGKNTAIGSNTSIFSISNHYRNLEDPNDMHQYSISPMSRKDQQSLILSPIVIEEYCGIGFNCHILPGAYLGAGTLVSPHCLVAGRYPKQSYLRNNATISLDGDKNLVIKQ